MEWFVLMAPMPAPVEFVLISAPALLVAWLVAAVPVLLAYVPRLPVRAPATSVLARSSGVSTWRGHV